MIIRFNFPQKQRGATFVTGLIFLVVLTLFGVTAMKTASMEERMSGNLRDRNLALQAAEMALRYAEHHIRDNDPTTNTPNPIDGVVDFDSTCTAGLCYYGTGAVAPSPAWTTYCTPTCPISYVAGTVFRVDGVIYTAQALSASLLAPPTISLKALKKHRLEAVSAITTALLCVRRVPDKEQWFNYRKYSGPSVGIGKSKRMLK